MSNTTHDPSKAPGSRRLSAHVQGYEGASHPVWVSAPDTFEVGDDWTKVTERNEHAEQRAHLNEDLYGPALLVTADQDAAWRVGLYARPSNGGGAA